jgi:hypothetical protein
MDGEAWLALFRRIALATAPLLAGGCTNYDCPHPVMNQTIAVDPSWLDGGTADAGPDELCQRALAPAIYAIRACDLVEVDGGPAVHVTYQQYCVGGRRPARWTAPAALGGAPGAVAGWLAETAQLEAASVGAFDGLARELGVHGAPPELVAAARGAMADERRHARVMGGLARRRGARPALVRELARRRPAELEAMATLNAVEGCVRETFAATVACRQAVAAADPEIRAAMATIAVEETRHAALSFAIDRWARARLGRAARERVGDARREAGETLLAAVASPAPAELCDAAGLPRADEAVRVARALRAQLWSEDEPPA